jgi:hypothetical protein
MAGPCMPEIFSKTVAHHLPPEQPAGPNGGPVPGSGRDGGQVAQLSPQRLGLTVFDPLFRMHEVDVRHATIGDFLVLTLQALDDCTMAVRRTGIDRESALP